MRGKGGLHRVMRDEGAEQRKEVGMCATSKLALSLTGFVGVLLLEDGVKKATRINSRFELQD